MNERWILPTESDAGSRRGAVVARTGGGVPRLPKAVGTVGGVGGEPAASKFAEALTGALSRIPAAGRLLSAPQTVPAAFRPAGGRTSGAGAFEDLIREVAQREGVDEQLVKAVVEAESGFNPRAVSPAGAKGLMQLMDGTARTLGVKDSFDPASNVAGGVKFLRSLLEKFGSVPLALAAYNAGPGAVEKYGGIPPYQETRSYVQRVMQLHQQNRLAAAGGTEGQGDGGNRVV